MERPDAPRRPRPGEIVSDHVRAAAVVYAAYHLEQAGLFRAADEIAARFEGGRLDPGSDTAAEILDRYYWDRGERLAEDERREVYPWRPPAARPQGSPANEPRRPPAASRSRRLHTRRRKP